MRRSPAVGPVVDFKTNDGLAWSIGDFVIIEDFDALTRSVAGYVSEFRVVVGGSYRFSSAMAVIVFDRVYGGDRCAKN